MQTQDAKVVEMQRAIYNQHTEGFEKALPCRLKEGTGFDIMKHMYKGELIPLKDILDEDAKAELTMEQTRMSLLNKAMKEWM